MKRFKKIGVALVAVLMIAAGSVAIFTDTVSPDSGSITAGNLAIEVVDVTLSGIVDENIVEFEVLNFGTERTLDYTVNSVGEGAVKTRDTVELTVILDENSKDAYSDISQCRIIMMPEGGLVLDESASYYDAENGVFKMVYHTPVTVMNGTDYKVEGGVDTYKRTFNLIFSPDAEKTFRGAKVIMETRVDAIQYSNTTDEMFNSDVVLPERVQTSTTIVEDITYNVDYPAGVYKFYKLEITEYFGNSTFPADYAKIAELVLLNNDVNIGKDAALIINSDSDEKGSDKSYAFDGDTTTAWNSGKGTTHWLEVEALNPSFIDGYGIAASFTEESEDWPVSWVLYGKLASEDEWKIIDEQCGVGYGWNSGKVRYFKLPII